MKENPDSHFIRYLGFLNQEILVPNSLAATKNILQTNCYSFQKPNWFLRLAKEIAGHGILFMEGNEHRAHRRMLTNPFALKSIRKLEPVFLSKAKDICVFLDQEIAANGGSTTEIESLDLFMRAILDIGMLPFYASSAIIKYADTVILKWARCFSVSISTTSIPTKITRTRRPSRQMVAHSPRLTTCSSRPRA